MMYLEVAAGFLLLLGGAEFLVRGAVGLSRRLGISQLVIGMTVVAFGTSAPELVVSLNAALSGAGAMAIGNVIGSNVANVLLIMGATGLALSGGDRPRALKRDSVVLVFGTLLFVVAAWQQRIAMFSGFALLIVYCVFIIMSYWRDTHGPRNGDAEDVEQPIEPHAGWRDWLALIAGIAGVLVGSELLVGGGVSVARAFGVSEEVIGLTLIAIGTSLPELAASVMAAIRGHSGVALGNVVGSNLFNLLAVVGVVGMVIPLEIPEQVLRFDLWILLLVTAILLPYLSGMRDLRRLDGVLMISSYILYLVVQAVGVSSILPPAG